MKSCVTIALVPSLTTGPWIYWYDLEACMQKAAALGFDAVELFTASAEVPARESLRTLSQRHQLAIAAVGTGAGKVLHGWTLTDPDPARRAEAVQFIRQMIAFGAEVEAPAIIGSMQGLAGPGVNREQALHWLAEGLDELGAFAESRGVPLIYEPLNRYETNLINRLDEGVALLASLNTRNVRLLADLFHMNLEETSLADSIRAAGAAIGHVHFADSNRRPVGFGHTPMREVAQALADIGYDGYLSAEALPWPDPDTAAQQTLTAFRQYFDPVPTAANPFKTL